MYIYYKQRAHLFDQNFSIKSKGTCMLFVGVSFAVCFCRKTRFLHSKVGVLSLCLSVPLSLCKASFLSLSISHLGLRRSVSAGPVVPHLHQNDCIVIRHHTALLLYIRDQICGVQFTTDNCSTIAVPGLCFPCTLLVAQHQPTITRKYAAI